MSRVAATTAEVIQDRSRKLTGFINYAYSQKFAETTITRLSSINLITSHLSLLLTLSVVLSVNMCRGVQAF